MEIKSVEAAYIGASLMTDGAIPVLEGRMFYTPLWRDCRDSGIRDLSLLLAEFDEHKDEILRAVDQTSPAMIANYAVKIRAAWALRSAKNQAFAVTEATTTDELRYLATSILEKTEPEQDDIDIFEELLDTLDKPPTVYLTGSKLLEGTGPLTKLSSAGLLDNITSVTARDISNMTDGTYARVLAAALSSGKIDLNAGTAGFANTLPTAQIADDAITAAKIGVNTWLAYRGTSNQTFTKKSLEKVQFNTEDWDEGADFDSATNYRWTNGDGQSFVHCEAQVTISTVENGSYAYIALRRNGTIVRQSEEYRNNSGGDRTNVRVSCDFGQIRCATTDYLEVFVFVDDSVDRDVVFGATETWFSGAQVRRA